MLDWSFNFDSQQMEPPKQTELGCDNWETINAQQGIYSQTQSSF